MENKNYVSKIHQQNKEWISSISFVRDEIEIYKNRLAEVVSKNTNTEVLAPAERFQNQFIRHDEVMDELIHDINEYEHTIVQNVKENNIAVEHRKVDANESLIERMEVFQSIYSDLKKEFLAYLSRVM